MGTKIISTFREKPKTKAGVWAMWLGLIAIVSPIILGTFGAAIRPAIDKAFSENVGAAVGFAVGILALTLSALALVTSIRAFRMGERSWAVWIGLVMAVFIGLFWAAMVAGEFIFPH